MCIHEESIGNIVHRKVMVVIRLLLRKCIEISHLTDCSEVLSMKIGGVVLFREEGFDFGRDAASHSLVLTLTPASGTADDAYFPSAAMPFTY